MFWDSSSIDTLCLMIYIYNITCCNYLIQFGCQYYYITESYIFYERVPLGKFADFGRQDEQLIGAWCMSSDSVQFELFYLS